ncbi:MAG: hypothetical protein U0325_26910 [Polyangiales bacterium]
MSRLKPYLRVLLALAMIAVGVQHFTNPTFFVRIVPPWVPDAGLAVAVSGVAEILGGLGLLHPRTRVAAAWGLIARYVAVFPANVHMAVHHIQPGPTPVPAWAAWARLPFQAVFIAWAWWNTRADDARPSSP